MRLKILNLKTTDMHIACEVGLLDIDCLHRMGEVEKLPNKQFRAAPSGPGLPGLCATKGLAQLNLMMKLAHLSLGVTSPLDLTD